MTQPAPSQGAVVHLECGFVRLRPIRGVDERLVAGVDAANARQLIDRLLTSDGDVWLGPGEAIPLTVAERDRVLAAIYGAEFGYQISATATCQRCGEPFDFDFKLHELVETIQDKPLAREVTLEDGTVLRVRG